MEKEDLSLLAISEVRWTGIGKHRLSSEEEDQDIQTIIRK